MIVRWLTHDARGINWLAYPYYEAFLLTIVTENACLDY